MVDRLHVHGDHDTYPSGYLGHVRGAYCDERPGDEPRGAGLDDDRARMVALDRQLDLRVPNRVARDVQPVGLEPAHWPKLDESMEAARAVNDDPLPRSAVGHRYGVKAVAAKRVLIRRLAEDGHVAAQALGRSAIEVVLVQMRNQHRIGAHNGVERELDERCAGR